MFVSARSVPIVDHGFMTKIMIHDISRAFKIASAKTANDDLGTVPYLERGVRISQRAA